MKDIFNKKDKSEENEKKLKEVVKSIETKELKNEIKEREEFIEIAQKEFNKRPDRKIKEVIGNSFSNIIDGGMIVFILGLFLLGAVPSYFDVNDEFLNPTINMSVNESLDTIQDAGYEALSIFHDQGVEHPKIFYWLFWIAIFMWLIYPIIQVIIFIYKKQKGGKK